MLKTFPIDFIRQVLEQKLFEEHIKNINLYGGKDQVSILSFYEQLKSQEQVDRFVETYRDLSEQQNRTGLILNGVLVSPENPTITNLYSSLIVPMSFTCSFRCQLANRDTAILTINNLIEKLKGKKVDIADLEIPNGTMTEHELFMVGTIGQNEGKPRIKNGDFIGPDKYSYISNVLARINQYKNQGVIVPPCYAYCSNGNTLRVVNIDIVSGDMIIPEVTTGDQELVDSRYVRTTFYIDNSYEESDVYMFGSAEIQIYGSGEETIVLQKDNGYIVRFEEEEYEGETYKKVTLEFDLGKTVTEILPTYEGFLVQDQVLYEKETTCEFIEDDGTYPDVVFPPENIGFDRYKISFSFDAIRCDEPRNLNGEEYCELSFGGSATLVSDGVQLGNDLLKIGIKKVGIKAETPITFEDVETYYLEPLEMPSGNNANTLQNQLLSNKFISNSHTDAIALTLQYTFIADFNNDLIKQWFKYARYGTQGITANDISPNMTYQVDEIWCSWGDYNVETIKTKLVENVDIENTESDTLTLSLTMQIQGEND